MENIATYYYLVKKIDYLNESKDYKNLYCDITTYIFNLEDKLQKDIVHRILNLKTKTNSIWFKDLKDFCSKF